MSETAIHRRSCRQTNASQLAASALQHEIQRTSASRLFFRSGRRAPIGLHRLGDSQTHAAYWLTAIFGGYDKARMWHFWLMWGLFSLSYPM